MKTLTAAADRATKRPYASPVYLAEIQFTSPAAKTLRVSDRYLETLADYAALVLSRGPTAYWRLGESAGTTAADASGNGHAGTYTNGPTLGQAGAISGDVDTAVSFDGVDDRVAAAAFTIPAAFSVEMWIRPTAVVSRVCFATEQAGPVGLRLYIGSDQRLAAMVNGGSIGGAASLVITGDVWTHVVWTNDGSTSRLYLNGVLQHTAAQAHASESRPVVIGDSDLTGATDFEGRIDEVAIYGTALSDAQVVQHYQVGTGVLAGVPLTEWLPLVADWGTLEEALNTVDADGRPATAEITLFNTKAVEGKPRISDLIRTPFNTTGTYDWAFAKVTISQLFEGLGSGDEIRLGVFFLEEPTEIDEALLTVRMSDQSLVLEDKLRVTRVTRAEFPQAPQEALGQSIPRVFGVLKNIPAVPVVDSAVGRLNGAITAGATTLTLEDASAFPSSGTVQIDSEHLPYTAKSGNQLTGVTSATDHRDLAPVYEVRSGAAAYRYVVGEHAGAFKIKGLSKVTVDGAPPDVSPSIELEATDIVPGKSFAALSFPAEAKFFNLPTILGERTVSVTTIAFGSDEGPHADTRTISPASVGGTVSTDRILDCHVSRGGNLNGNATWKIKRRLSGGTDLIVAEGVLQQGQGGPVNVSDTRIYTSTADEVLTFDAHLNDTESGHTISLVIDQYRVKDRSTLTGGGPTTIGDVACDIEGIQDDASGSLSGTANLLLENPADIAKFILTQLAPGVALADLGSTWATTRASLAAEAYKWAFLLEFTEFSKLRRKLGEQARSVLYLEGGKWEFAFLAENPAAQLTLDYERDVASDFPARVRRTPRTDVRNSLSVSSERDYRDGSFRRVKTHADLTQAGLTDAFHHDLVLDFIQDPATADAAGLFWLRIWRRQRFEVELAAWWNILATEKIDYLALDNHPVLDAHGGASLVFRVVGKRVLLSEAEIGRIALRLIDTGLASVPNSTAAGEEDMNYTFNGDVEVWGAGSSAAPTGWALTGAGATVARDATNKKVGSYAVALTRVGADCYLAQSPDTFPGYGGVGWWKGRQVTFGCWVRATVANRARLAINDGVGTTFSSYHTGGSAFEFLTVSRVIDGAATKVEPRLVVDTGDTTAQFDGAVLVFGTTVADYVPGGWRGRKATLYVNSEPTTGVGGGVTTFLYPSTSTVVETPYSPQVPFACVARNLVAQAQAPGASQTRTYTIRRNGVDTLVTCQLSGASQTEAADITNEAAFAKLDNLAIKLVTSASAVATFETVMCELEEIPA